ncbi:hypothetical protein SBOR_0868 [Sclerotinia borealis F-4128]|uniref:Amidase domain-containing protein n=1 Tax=Sclerotinia borealis (strain F-4128) TaxID=1432307 RepID=W9CPL8_SCLBF|nr:hypothetical protein SBOR_0868 [Sclerotinia borealis F-4128]
MQSVAKVRTEVTARHWLHDKCGNCRNIYLAQIKKHNRAGAQLHAIISTPTKQQLLDVAQRLDQERKTGKIRGPLHGVPIIVKDAFATVPSLGMPTTVGSYALIDSRPKKNAAIIDVLIQNGLIILGKTNLTEFCGFKGTGGWSAVEGMCQSPYILGGFKKGEKRRGETAPGGSSTGSAVGVAAGFCPISLGTETSGSLTSPASRAALQALKLTPGSVSMEGVWEVASTYDTAGAMAKSVLDLALVSDMLLRTTRGGCSKVSLTKSIRSKWQGLSVGFVDIEKWRLPLEARDPDPGYDEQSFADYQRAIQMIQEHGGRVVHPVHITPPEEYIVDSEGGNVDDLMDNIMRSQARDGCKKYLSSLEYSKVNDLKDIINFNQANAAIEFDDMFCPNQNGLEKALEATMSAEDLEKNLQICRQWAATKGVDKIIEECNVDVIVGPCDSFFAGLGVGANYPLASIPFGVVKSSGRPYGLHVIARAYEGKIISFMGAWEATWPARKIPDLDAVAGSL